MRVTQGQCPTVPLLLLSRAWSGLSGRASLMPPVKPKSRFPMLPGVAAHGSSEWQAARVAHVRKLRYERADSGSRGVHLWREAEVLA